MSTLKGISCLVTAGPTYEAIDPVRFIGNRSSGKMGIAIAEELAERGAAVTLIIGPTSIPVSDRVQTVIRVESADDMYSSVNAIRQGIQLGIFAAAVADYRPAVKAHQKIKKSDERMVLELVKTKDILKAVGTAKNSNQVIVGFALETENELKNAQKKLMDKNLDLIVLNSLNDAQAGFQFDTNKITILDRENNMTNFELKTKSEVAKDIVEYIEKKFF